MPVPKKTARRLVLIVAYWTCWFCGAQVPGDQQVCGCQRPI